MKKSIRELELEIENAYLRQRLADIYNFSTSDVKTSDDELWSGEFYCRIRACISVMSDLKDIDSALEDSHRIGTKPFYPVNLYKEWEKELFDK